MRIPLLPEDIPSINQSMNEASLSNPVLLGGHVAVTKDTEGNEGTRRVPGRLVKEKKRASIHLLLTCFGAFSSGPSNPSCAVRAL